MNNIIKEFKTLVQVVAALRGPEGCPWDKQQSPVSLTPFILEECYELIEALENGNNADIQDELGDYLFQVILQAQVFEDLGKFNLENVISQLHQKLVRRHPHVFSKTKANSVEEVWQNWEKIKVAEKTTQLKPKKVFNLPKNLPALQSSHKIGVKTERYKFDWDCPEEVFAKLTEEVAELKEALDLRNKQISELEKNVSDYRLKSELAHEIGDVLFSTTQLARHLGLDAEQCLREANLRFQERFSLVLRHAEANHGADSAETFAKLSKEQKELLWVKAKSDLKK